MFWLGVICGILATAGGIVLVGGLLYMAATYGAYRGDQP